MSISPGPGHGLSATPAQPASQAYASAPAAHAASAGSKTIPALIVALVALAGANVYSFFQIDGLKKALDRNNTALTAEIDKVREATSVSAQTSRRTVETLRGQLDAERRQARLAVGAARTEALKKMEETREKLESAQAAAQQQVNSKISEVRQAADTANTKVAEVGTEVNTVKTDLGATKSELEKTVADLKRVSGDVDGHSTLIATNATELKALRTLGERNYLEFDLRKAKQPQKVGDVMIQLRKADPKHNRYTIQLTADDKTVEKKDRTINEPLQFLTSKARQPYEIVVNKVEKDHIAGYLAVPKVLNGR